MQKYYDFMDNLPYILKVLIAIFLNILWVIYRLFKDIEANDVTLILFDVLFGIVPIPVVFWVLNLIWIIVKKEVFSFQELVTTVQAAEAKEKEEKPSDSESSDK